MTQDIRTKASELGSSQGLTEKDIVEIFYRELKKNAYSGNPIVPRHNHDNINSPRISQANIINSVGIMGKINFTTNSTYTLYFSAPNPTRLDLNGFAFDTGAADSSAIIIGVALLSPAFYFQPLTNRSAKEGGTQYPIGGVLAQCSSNLYVQDAVGTANTFPHTEQFYIMNAFTAAGAHIVTGQLQNLTPNSIDIVITNLLSNWNVSANFIIT